MRHLTSIIFLILFCFSGARAQENYEIQVYGSQTMQEGATMFELHSNYTFGGNEYVNEGVLPTHHVIHETIEITHGFNDWFETGFYFFNAIGNHNRSNYVGSHLRPRVMVPEKWGWPVGLSLSIEAGYQKKDYSPDDWSVEIRPIIDKTWRNLYISFNPVLGKAIHGLNTGKGYDFSPNLKASYKLTKLIAAGIEYYGLLGTSQEILPIKQEEHQLFFVTDLSWSPDWEFNAGYGIGLTGVTENDIFKVILGYRLHKKAHR